MNTRSDTLANARLAAIVGSSTDAIVAKDLHGIITDWNPAAERLLGYTAEEAVGRHISLIAPPGRAHEMSEILNRIVQGELVEHFDTKRRRKDGRLVDVSLTVSPIYDSDGRVVGASKIARDITDRKRIAAELGLLAAIVSSSDDAIISCDLEGNITSWNKAAERLYGYSAEAIVGRNVSLIAVPGREAEPAELLEKVRSGEAVEHYETERRREDGSIAEISLTVSPVYDAEHNIVGVSKIARDIALRLETERRLKLLMGEIDHRAKNVLAVAQAILRLTKAESLPAFVSAVEGRIKALARVHTQVAENRWDGAELRELAVGSLDTFGGEGRRTQIEGPRVWLTPAASQVVGVLLYELATNAAKHGALSVRDGAVDVGWRLGSAGEVHLTWNERGGPPVSEPSRRSFGTQVIERNVPDQLGGASKIDWLPAGLSAEFTIPPAHIVQMQPFRRNADDKGGKPRLFAG